MNLRGRTNDYRIEKKNKKREGRTMKIRERNMKVSEEQGANT